MYSFSCYQYETNDICWKHSMTIYDKNNKRLLHIYDSLYKYGFRCNLCLYTFYPWIIGNLQTIPFSYVSPCTYFQNHLLRQLQHYFVIEHWPLFSLRCPLRVFFFFHKLNVFCLMTLSPSFSLAVLPFNPSCGFNFMMSIMS